LKGNSSLYMCHFIIVSIILYEITWSINCDKSTNMRWSERTILIEITLYDAISFFFTSLYFTDLVFTMNIKLSLFCKFSSECLGKSLNWLLSKNSKLFVTKFISKILEESVGNNFRNIRRKMINEIILNLDAHTYRCCTYALTPPTK
jgi:hypothetical protein